MATINVLRKEIFNRIAAGEVVEGPKSIVKELAENAIDAGADTVTIEIAGGGIDAIVVADDGSGIPNSEVRKAFLPHATSKIKTAEDMDTIGTLGFRGEALPSIAAVAKVTLRTKCAEETAGTLLRIKGGEEEEFGACALEQGTVVEVRSLFFNTPARYKFLKSARSEESATDAVVQGLILSNPNVAIRYLADGVLKLASDGGGLESAAQAVYPSMFERFLPVSRADGGYRISGFISEPGLAKGNRSGQTIVLNGRVVTDPALSATVQNAYRERLMTRSFPFFVLDIVMPFDAVDVNVHPAKAEVRLRDPRRLYGIVYRAVKDALERRDRALENAFLDFTEPSTNGGSGKDGGRTAGNAIGNTIGNAEFQERAETASDRSAAFGTAAKTLETPDFSPGYANVDAIARGIFKRNDADFSGIVENSRERNSSGTEFNRGKIAGQTEIPENSARRASEAEFDAVYAAVTGKSAPSSAVFQNSESAGSATRNAENIAEKPINFVQNDLFVSDSAAHAPKNHAADGHGIRVVGQIFKCYLIAERGEKGFLIDQHAAHERTIYDRLMKSAESESAESQPLLLPYVFEGSAEECDFILKNRDALLKIGFELEEFGKNSMKVYAVPSALTGMDFAAFFRDILADMNGIKSLKTEELLKKRLATLACKSAIKAGDELSQEQIAYFIEVYTASGAPILCPHGRPTILPFDKIELEKRFKRKL